MSRKRKSRRRAKADAKAIRRLCDMTTDEVAEKFGATGVAERFAFIDNGAKVLGVCHMDTVNDGWLYFADPGPKKSAAFNFVSGSVRAIELDDRLGIYVMTDLLPKLGVKIDWLLTDNEESGQSSAMAFEPPKEYNWMVGFDRSGLDVVMYQYEDMSWGPELEELGMSLERGSYSDIADLEHLGVTGFNWGVGYHRQHSNDCYARLADVTKSAHAFVKFYERNKDEYMPWEAPIVPLKKKWTYYDDDWAWGNHKGTKDWVDRLYDAYLKEKEEELGLVGWEEEYDCDDEYPCSFCGGYFPREMLGYYEGDMYCIECADSLDIPSEELDALPTII